MYRFTEDCMLGIEQIDNEHKKLFSLINEAYELLKSEDTNLRVLFKGLLEQLKDYANTHFEHEEAYMKEINDPELKTQQQEHADFKARVNQINLERIDSITLKQSMSDLMDYLSRWLFRHIIGSDTLIGKFESPFAFTSKYHTGIELVDEEHKRLFEIIGDANNVIHAQLLHDKYDEIMRIISDLRDYTKKHFADEEEYMESINYPGISEQKKAHQIFIDKLAGIDLYSLDDNQQEYLEELIEFLLNWLSVHILNMDKRIGDYQAGLE